MLRDGTAPSAAPSPLPNKHTKVDADDVPLSQKKKTATRVLTVNNDLCLLALPVANAGDVAAVEASVGDIDPVDGQDAHGLCGLRQSFPMGLYVDQAVCLAGGRETCSKSSDFSFINVISPTY